MLALLLAATLAGLVAGCWDRTEIGERLYVLSLVADRPATAESQVSDQKPAGKPPIYRIAVEIGLWKQLRGGVTGGGGKVGGGGGGGGGGGTGGGLSPEKPAWVMASTADTVGAALDHMHKRSYRVLSLSHLKVVVLGEDLAKRGIAGTLDFLERNREVQRRVEVAVTPGPALSLLQASPPADQLVALTLPQLLATTRRSPHSVDTSVGELVTRHHAKMAYLVPRVRLVKDGLLLGGAAVMQKDRLIGWLGERECAGVNWITGRVKQQVLEYHLPEYGLEEAQVLLASAQHRRLKLTIEQGKPVFHLTVSASADLQESPYAITSREAVRRTIRAGAAAIRRDIERALAAQRRLKAEFCGFDELVRAEAPEMWSRVSDRWEEYFLKEARVQVDVRVRLRHTGAIR